MENSSDVEVHPREYVVDYDDSYFENVVADYSDAENEYKKRKEYEAKNKLYHEKCEFLLSDRVRYGFDLEFEEIDLREFFDWIFDRSSISAAYDFEEVQSEEYKVWKKHDDAGELVDYKSEYSMWRYNPIVLYREKKNGKITNNHKLILKDDEETMNFIEGRQFAISSPITYVGNHRNGSNGRYLFAFAVDLDGVGMPQLRDLLFQQTLREGSKLKHPFAPTANIIVNSGNGVHLYYLLEKPLPLYKENIQMLRKMKDHLTSLLWNEYTSTIENIQKQGIFQGFRLPGTLTKFGVPIRAFHNIGSPYHTLSELNEYFSPYPDMRPLTEEEIRKIEGGDRKPSTMTRKAAQEQFPEWYERVVNQGIRTPKKWQIKNDLYEWWLRRLWSNKISDKVNVGHRFFCLLMLAVYAKKCKSISFDRLKKDAFALLERFESLTEEEDNHFTASDVEDALLGYKLEYITFPKASVEYLTALKMPTNRRNGKKQETHLKLARLHRDFYSEEKGRKDWRDGNGRKKGSHVEADKSPAAKLVQEWRLVHPNDANKSRCAKDTGLNRDTVAKWWSDDRTPQQKVKEWREANPDNDNKSQCARECCLDRKTVAKWW